MHSDLSVVCAYCGRKQNWRRASGFWVEDKETLDLTFYCKTHGPALDQKLDLSHSNNNISVASKNGCGSTHASNV